MKKNTKTYLLLAIVLIIWGTIAYRIFSSLSSDTGPEVKVNLQYFKPKPIAARDTFSISGDYRDPFLGTIYGNKEKITTTKKPPKVQESVPDRDIRYTGLITDASTKQKIFFVGINGQQHLMGTGDKIDGVTLLSGTLETITVKDGAKSRTITLQK